MLRGDRSLECEWTRLTAKCFFDQSQRFVDLWSIPERAILLFEHNQITVFIKSSLAPGVV